MTKFHSGSPWWKYLTTLKQNLLLAKVLFSWTCLKYAWHGGIICWTWLGFLEADENIPWTLLQIRRTWSQFVSISNHIIFLVQFGIDKHLYIFQRPQIALALWVRAILLVFEKINRNHVITYTKWGALEELFLKKHTQQWRERLKCMWSNFYYLIRKSFQNDEEWRLFYCADRTLSCRVVQDFDLCKLDALQNYNVDTKWCKITKIDSLMTFSV